jgi:hypothetical protein
MWSVAANSPAPRLWLLKFPIVLSSSGATDSEGYRVGMRRRFVDTEGHYAVAFLAGWGVLSRKKWHRRVDPGGSGVNNFFRVRSPFRPLSATQDDGESPKRPDPQVVR